MRLFATLMFVLALPLSAMAQDAAPTEPTLDKAAPADLSEVMAIAKRRRNIGRVVAAPGIGLGAIGVGMMATGGIMLATGSACSEGQPDCAMGPVLLTGAGVGFTAVSAPFLAVGLPLWIKNQRRLDGKVAVAAVPTSGGGSLAVAARF